MTMDARLRAYLPNGASQGLLPAPGDWDLSAPLNDVSALKLDYAVGAPRSELLGQPLEVALEVSGDGGASWVEPRGCRFLYLTDGRDPLKVGDSWQADLKGYLWLLKKARIASNPTDPVQGKRTWQDPVTPGRILGLFVNEAKARGALAGMTRTWTDTHDTAGQPWPETLLRQYDAGADLLTVAMDLADAGYVDVQTTGRDLQLYVPELGQDRTTGANQVTLTATSSPSAPFRRTWEGVAGVIMGLGDADLALEYVNPGAVQPWGRWEEYVTHSGVSDPGTLTTLMEHQGELSEGPRLEFTQDIEPSAGPRPFVDFQVGDYVWSRDLAGSRERYRVRQITLRGKGGALTANVVLNDRFLESDIRTQRRLQAISGGASTSGSTGTPPGADILPPMAPTQPVLSSAFYMDGGGSPHAQVTVDWADVTTNMDGSGITDLASYQVWDKPTGSSAWRQVGETQAGTSVAFLSPYPAGTEWDFRVRAVDTAGNLSAFSPTASILTAMDAEAPEVPSAPVATSQNGLIEVAWDGLNSAGNPQDEPDLFRVEVHVVASAATVPTPGSSATMKASFTGPGTVVIPGYAVGQTYYVRLVAVDASLNASGPSVADAVTVVATATDGSPPDSTGWTVELEPLGLMALNVTWVALPNPDALLYRVYAAPETPVPLNASTLVGETGGTGLSFGAIDGEPLVAGADYYVAVVAYDDDGDAAAVTAGPQRVQQAGDGSVAQDWTYMGPVSATQLQTGNLTATLAIIGELATAGSGRRVSFSSADGITAVDPNGDLVAQIPTDLTRDISLQADVVAKSVTALGSVAMRATDNELAQAAALLLRSATAAPVSPPSAVIEWEAIARSDANPSIYHGGNYYASRYYQAYGAWGVGGVRELNQSGAATGNLPISGGNVWGAYRNGDHVYALVQTPGNIATNAGGQWQVRKYHWANQTLVSQWVLANDPDAYTSAFPEGTPTICRGAIPDGCLVLVLPTGGVLRRFSYNADTGAVLNQDASVAYSGRVTWAYEGLADTGVTRLWWGGPNAGARAVCHVVNPAGSSFARDSSRDVPLASDGLAAMFTWDAGLGRFISLNQADGTLHRYDGGAHAWVGTETQNWYVTNTWRDNDSGGTGLHETVQGPATVVAMKRRARLRVTTPPIPTDANNANLDDPNAVSIYVGNVDGTRATQFRQAAPATGVRSALLSAAVFSNADTLHPNPPSVGNFPNLTPASIRSDAADGNGAMAKVDGDGSVRFGDLTVSTTGQVKVGTRILAAGVTWTTPSLQASWVNAGSPWPNAGYALIDGVVWLRGAIVNGQAGFAPFFLPVGLRPGFQRQFMCRSSHASGFSNVLVRATDGAVYMDSNLTGGAGAAWFLDSIHFPAGG
jgi:hypothetical protein